MIMIVLCTHFSFFFSVGEGGLDGDGDVTKPSNLTAFKEYVLEHTNKKGVHFVMADGVRNASIKCVLIGM